MIYITSSTRESLFLMVNLNLLTDSLGFCYDRQRAAYVSISKLIHNSCMKVNGLFLLVAMQMKTIRRMLKLIVSWYSMNFFTFVIMFRPYMIVWTKTSNLPCWSTMLEASIAE